MTGSEMVTKLQNMVDDVIDTDYAYQLLNDAKDDIESSHLWEQLKALDSAQTETQSSIALPSSFANPIKLYIGTEHSPYTLVPFEDSRLYRDYQRAYYIDFPNSAYYLTGTRNTSNPIYFFYIKYSPEVTSGTSWVFPERFHNIIPYKMAQIYYASNAGEKARAWDDRWKAYYDEALTAMQAWDDQLKLRANRGVQALRRGDLPKGIVQF